MNLKDLLKELAQKGHRVPVGTDLVLKDHPDAEEIALDGKRLGQVYLEAADRYKTPLALPLMDLRNEKAAIAAMLGITPAEEDTFHFDSCPSDETIADLLVKIEGPLSPKLQAAVDSVAYVKANSDLVPVGMAIGPFSLMTKMLADPITPIFMAGMGETAETDSEVKMVEKVLQVAVAMVLRSLKAQIDAGAKMVFIAEPAANVAFISPMQLEAGADLFERYVLVANRAIVKLLNEKGVLLFFHCCGELVDSMVRDFGSLNPAVLSLGSSRNLWEDAHLVPEDTILYGNLPSKKFYSDDLMSVEATKDATCRIAAHMKQTGHLFILGSECDVLSVKGCHETIKAKVQAIIDTNC